MVIGTYGVMVNYFASVIFICRFFCCSMLKF
uniref:Uncharacterized protein n=1 Tax=Arundo donax TaxID=35708 RepID=A0A0A8ZFI2_ARUDO